MTISNYNMIVLKRIITLAEIISIAIIIIGIGFVHSAGLMHGNQSGKLYFFLGILSLVLLIRAIRLSILKSKSISIRITWMDMFLLMFFIYVLISRLFISGIRSYTLPFMELCGLALLYIIFRTIRRDLLFYLLIAVIISGIAQAVYGTLQIYGYYPSHHHLFKLTGGFFNPGPYSGYLISALPVAIALLIYNNVWKIPFKTGKTNRQNAGKFSSHIRLTFTWMRSNIFPIIEKLVTRGLPLLAVFLIITLLPAAKSRAAWAGLALAIIWILTLKYPPKKYMLSYINNRFRIIGFITLLFVLAGSSIAGMYHLKKDSADGRILIWEVSSGMIKDSPITGHGYEMFKAKYMNYQASFFSEKPDNQKAMLADDNRYAFNEPVKLWVETGLIGLSLAIAIVIIAFTSKPGKITTTKDKFILAGSRAGLLAIIGFGMFSYPSEILPIKLNSLIFLSAIASYGNSFHRSVNISNGKIVFLLKFIFITIVITIISLIIYIRGDFHQTYKNWQSAFNTYSYGSYESSVESYSELYPSLKHNGDFLVNYGKALSMSEQHDQAIMVLNKADVYMNNSIVQNAQGDSYKALGKYDKAEKAYRKAHYMAPGKFYPLYLLAKLYEESGQNKKALDLAEKILEKEVKIPSVAIDEMKREMKKMVENYNSNE